MAARGAPSRDVREERRVQMKAPIPLPFVEKGEDIPPSGVTLQAVLGFLLPFILIIICGLIVYFMIVGRLNRPEPGAEALLHLFVG
jgi:hypothetical protein